MANPQQSHAIFDLDTVAPFQYCRVFQAKAQPMPEKKLLFAVLNDAIECLEN